MVTGLLKTPTGDLFQKNQVALELVAASLDAGEVEPLLSFVPGVPFNPASNGVEPVRFRLALPTDRAHVMFFQIPVQAAGGVGQFGRPGAIPGWKRRIHGCGLRSRRGRPAADRGPRPGRGGNHGGFAARFVRGLRRRKPVQPHV